MTWRDQEAEQDTGSRLALVTARRHLLPPPASPGASPCPAPAALAPQHLGLIRKDGHVAHQWPHLLPLSSGPCLGPTRTLHPRSCVLLHFLRPQSFPKSNHSTSLRASPPLSASLPSSPGRPSHSEALSSWAEEAEGWLALGYSRRPTQCCWDARAQPLSLWGLGSIRGALAPCSTGCITGRLSQEPPAGGPEREEGMGSAPRPTQVPEPSQVPGGVNAGPPPFYPGDMETGPCLLLSTAHLLTGVCCLSISKAPAHPRVQGARRWQAQVTLRAGSRHGQEHGLQQTGDQDSLWSQPTCTFGHHRRENKAWVWGSRWGGQREQGQSQLCTLVSVFFFFFNFNFLLLFNYSCVPFLPIPPPHPNPPPSPTSILPLDFVHVSFIVVPVIPSPHCPLPTPS